MIRRAIGTTLASLCALTGPLAGGAFATTDPGLTLSASSARPGAAFTVAPAGAVGCPAASGVQTVELTFTDSAGIRNSIGSTETDEDGIWGTTTAQLPVAGLDGNNEWSDQPVAPGAGTVSAACFVRDDSGEDTDGDEDGDGEDPGDDDASVASLDDDGDASEVATLTYAGVAFTATGSAPKLSLSVSIIKPGEAVTVTPSEACSGASVVTVGLISLSATDDDGDADEPGDEGEEGDDDGEDTSGLPTASVTTSTSGTWSTSLAVPAGTDTGDYAVTAACSVGGAVTSSYDAEPLALGTVRIGPATCGARSAFAPLTGTYTGDLAGKGDVSLPSKFPLNGDGPWKISLRSAATGQVLAARTVSCAKLRYELGTTKPGLSDANKPRVRVCNTGRSPVTAILKLWKGKEFQKADAEVLDAGECVWLEGPRLDKGGQAKAQVLIDAPGKGSDDVVETFTVKRPKR